MLDKLTAADFRPHLGTRFRVEGPGVVELTLTAVDDGPEQPHAPRPFPFSIVFTGDAGDAGDALGQGIHPLDHPELGRLELFLVPVQPGSDGRPRYEAVFN